MRFKDFILSESDYDGNYTMAVPMIQWSSRAQFRSGSLNCMILADWLDDHGQADGAQLIRATLEPQNNPIDPQHLLNLARKANSYKTARQRRLSPTTLELSDGHNMLIVRTLPGGQHEFIVGGNVVTDLDVPHRQVLVNCALSRFSYFMTGDIEAAARMNASRGDGGGGGGGGGDFSLGRTPRRSTPSSRRRRARGWY